MKKFLLKVFVSIVVCGIAVMTYTGYAIGETIETIHDNFDAELLYDGGTGNFNDISETEDGYVAVGSVDQVENGYDVKGTGALIVKYDKQDKMIWQKILKGSYAHGDDTFNSVVVTEDGYVVVGHIVDYDEKNVTSTRISVIIKFDKNGNIMWKSPFTLTSGLGNTNTAFNTVIATEDGYVVVGKCPVDFNDDKKEDAEFALIAKIDKSGKLLWSNTFGGDNTDYFGHDDSCFNSVIETDDGYAAVGYSSEGCFGNGDWNGISGKGEKDAVIVKFDKTGKVMWKKNFGGSKQEYFNAVVAVEDGVTVVGTGAPNGGDWGADIRYDYSSIIVKFDKNGNIDWKNYLTNGEYNDIIVSEDGYIAAGTNPCEALYSDKNFGVIVKYNKSGEMEWNKTFTENRDFSVFNAVIETQNGYIAAGTIEREFVYKDNGTIYNGSVYFIPHSMTVKFSYTENVENDIVSNADDKEFMYNFGKESDDDRIEEVFNAVAVTEDGCLVIGTADGDADTPLLMVKYDKAGNIVWKNKYEPFANEWFNSIIAVDDGYVAVGSGDTYINQSGKAGVIVKFDKAGNIKWRNYHRYSNPNYMYAYFIDVAEAEDGYVAAGAWGGAVKYNKEGKIEWENKYGGTFNSIASVDDGYVIVGDCVRQKFGKDFWIGVDNKDPNEDYLETLEAIIIKIDKSGNVIWKKNFGGMGNDSFSTVLAVDDGYIAAGECGSASFGNGDLTDLRSAESEGNYNRWQDSSDSVMVKYDKYGNIVWKKNYGKEHDDSIEDVAITDDGYVAVCNNSEVWDYIALVIKVDKDGKKIWEKSFDGDGEDYFYGIGVSGNYVIAVGCSEEDSFGNGDWQNLTGYGYKDATIVKFKISEISANVEQAKEDTDFKSGDIDFKSIVYDNDDDGFCAVEKVDDGYVVVGYRDDSSYGSEDWTKSDEFGVSDGKIVKYDNDGNIMWQNHFGGVNSDSFEDVAVVEDGYIAVGYSGKNSFGTGDWTGIVGNGWYDAIMVKYGKNGNIIWKKHFGGSGDDIFKAVTVVNDGFIAVGESEVEQGGNAWNGITGRGRKDGIIVKFDKNGNVVWKNCFGGIYTDSFFGVAAAEDGYVAVGEVGNDSYGTGDLTDIAAKGGDNDAIYMEKDAVIVKYDTNGNLVWKKNFGGSDLDTFYDVDATWDGYIAVGESRNASFGNHDWAGINGKGGVDAIIVKYDKNGNVVWKNNFGGGDYETFNKADVDSAGAIWAAGYAQEGTFNSGDWTGNVGFGGKDGIIVKCDSNGNIIWKRHFGGSGDDSFLGVSATSHGCAAAGLGYITGTDKDNAHGDWKDIDGYNSGSKGAATAVFRFTESNCNIAPAVPQTGNTVTEPIQGAVSTPAVSTGYTALLPPCRVTMNGVVVDNNNLKYPFIMYNNITYFPMTYYDSRFLGIGTEYTPETGLNVFRLEEEPGEYIGEKGAQTNKLMFDVVPATGKITVNGKSINNSEEEYPLLVFREVTYFPMTWRFCVTEFEWEYNYTNEEGLVINTK